MLQLVNEDENAFLQHKQIIYGLIHMRGDMQILGFDGHLAKSMPLYVCIYANSHLSNTP